MKPLILRYVPCLCVFVLCVLVLWLMQCVQDPANALLNRRLVDAREDRVVAWRLEIGYPSL